MTFQGFQGASKKKSWNAASSNRLNKKLTKIKRSSQREVGMAQSHAILHPFHVTTLQFTFTPQNCQFKNSFYRLRSKERKIFFIAKGEKAKNFLQRNYELKCEKFLKTFLPTYKQLLSERCSVCCNKHTIEGELVGW